MSRFDVSARATELCVPLAVLEQLQRELGDYMLIGALARDLHVAGIAGLPLGRATQDLDISIAVGSLSSDALRKGLEHE